MNNSRKMHALAACSLFVLIATAYCAATGRSVELWRIAAWGGAGVTMYVALSYVFGFDPHRTRIARYAPALLHYLDRWELRLGQATLSMLGCIVIGAKFLDEAHFVTAVVSGVFAAWTYFALRWYAGGYHSTGG